jgi:hypothetical protein
MENSSGSTTLAKNKARELDFGARYADKPNKKMRKKPKQYPMNGPSLHIQALMERPLTNKAALRKWAKANPTMRPETLAVIP